ncbi:MAG: PilZ domain-containing protein, partial [Oscillospiraceae bacterium]
MTIPRITEEIYLILDSRYTPLAQAVQEDFPADGQWQIRVLDGKIDNVLAHQIVQLVGARYGSPALLGRIVSHRGDTLVLASLRNLGEEVRENLRIPTQFDSVIYPLTGGWRGQRPVQGADLSCGGVAFYCAQPLENRERLELVLPVTELPLLLKCEILHPRPSLRSMPLYAAKFVDLVEEETALVREAVFGIQIRNRG